MNRQTDRQTDRQTERVSNFSGALFSKMCRKYSTLLYIFHVRKVQNLNTSFCMSPRGIVFLCGCHSTIAVHRGDQ
jgi:hypothetical protein